MRAGYNQRISRAIADIIAFQRGDANLLYITMRFDK